MDQRIQVTCVPAFSISSPMWDYSGCCRAQILQCWWHVANHWCLAGRESILSNDLDQRVAATSPALPSYREIPTPFHAPQSVDRELAFAVRH